MLAGDGVAASENLRLHGAGNVHQMNPSSAGLARFWRGRDRRLVTGPAAKNFLDSFEHRCGVKIADHQQQCVLRRVEIPVNGEQIVTLVGGDLLFGRCNLRVRVRAKENFSEALAGEEARLGAIQFHFFKFLTAFAFKFGLGERGFARQLVYELQKGLGKLGETSEGNGAIVGSGVGGEIGAKATEVFFDLTARALCRSSAQDSGRHFSEPGSTLDRRRIAGAQKKLAVKLRDRVRFGEDDLEAVSQASFRAFGPRDLTLCGKRRNRTTDFGCSASGHLCGLLYVDLGRSAGIWRASENDGALVIAQVFFRDCLDVLTPYREKAIKDAIDELRLLVE